MKKNFKIFFTIIVLFSPLAPVFAVSPSVSIQSLWPGTAVTAGSGVFFTASASGFTNPSYSVTDSFDNSSLLGSSINSSGGFSWIPKTYDVGAHTITVTATDPSGNRASASQSITVNPVASGSIQSLLPGATVSFGQLVTFNVVTAGFTNPVFNVSDSLQGTVSNANINSSGKFSWTPMTVDAGVHNLTITVSDSSNNPVYLSQTLTVVNASMIIQGVSSGSPVSVGTPFSFTATSTGLINPSYTVTDYFNGGTVSNTNINSSGYFSWIPAAKDVGTHTIVVSGRDANGHTGSANIAVTVSAVSAAQTVTPSSTPLNTNSATPTKTTTSQYKFLKPLNIGSTGTDVTELQKRLKAEGIYSGPLTGYYGALTSASVKKYQGLHGIQKLGNVGPATRTSLNGGL